jgi:hypothetical protein
MAAHFSSEHFGRLHYAPKIANLNLAERLCHAIHMSCDKSRIKPDDRMTASSFRQNYYLQIPKGIFALSYRQNMRYEQYSLWQYSKTHNQAHES